MTEYYLATDGDDSNPGTESAPFGSLQQLLSTLSAGDVGYARAGTYFPTGYADATEQAGKKNSPIRLESYPGEQAVFDFGNDTYGGLRFWNCAYWELRNFTVRNAPSYGIYLFGGTSDTLIENVVVDGSGGDPNTSGFGIHVKNSPNTTLRACEVMNSYDPASGGGNADGISVKESTGAVIEDCVSHDNSDDGIDLWLQENATVRNCVTYGNGWAPDGTSAGDGNGFKLGGGGTSGGHLVTNCVTYGNRKRGFHFNTADVPMEVYNCTAWDNPTNYYFVNYAHVLRNNISFEGSEMLDGTVDDAANSWNLGISQPSFASTDPTSSKFLRLTSDSPAVDAGVDVGLPYAGEAPDLGAYETDPNDDTTSSSNPALKVATADGSGGVAFTTGTVRYFDGSTWRAPAVKYYDGSGFQSIAEASPSSDTTLVDGFERGDLTPYAGDLSSYAVTTERAAVDSNSLKSTGAKSSWRHVYSTSGLNSYVPYGSTFRVQVYISDPADAAIVWFGVADGGNWLGAGYNGNQQTLQLGGEVNGSRWLVGESAATPAVGEWTTYEIEWGVDAADQVAITWYDASGAELGSASATTSSNQGNTGIGFMTTRKYGGSGPVYFDDFRVV